MPEVEIIGEWEQLPTEDLRLPMFVEPTFGAVYSLSHSEPTGPILPADYYAEVLNPARDHVQGVSGTVEDFLSIREVRSWVSTLNNPGFGIGRTYLTSADFGGSATTLVDFNPMAEWRPAAQLAIQTAFLASRPDLVELGYGTGDILIDWEDFSFYDSTPWGTFANRQIEFDITEESNTNYDVEGVSTGPSTAETIDVWAVPVGNAEGYETPLPLADVATGKWRVVDFNNRVTDKSFLDNGYLSGNENIGQVPGYTNVAVLNLDDEWWEANAWLVEHPDEDYAGLGLPIITGPIGTFEGVTDPWGLEQHSYRRTTGIVHLLEEWTPPRHRVRYFKEVTGLPPRRITGRGDALMGGAERVYPTPRSLQRSNRVAGEFL